MTKTQKLIMALGVIAVSFMFGRLSVLYHLQSENPIKVVTEQNPKIPLVNIMAIEDDVLIGYASNKKVRVKTGDAIAVPDQEGRFELSLSSLGFLPPRRPIVFHEVPEWAVYVASKNGKNFYPVESPSGKRLSAATRVYFKTKDEALAAGFKAGSGVK